PVGGLLHRRRAGEPTLAVRELERDRRPPAAELELTVDGEAAVRATFDLARAEFDRAALQHLVVDRLGDVGPVVVVQALHAAGALQHAQRARVGGQPERRLRLWLEGRLA